MSTRHRAGCRCKRLHCHRRAVRAGRLYGNRGCGRGEFELELSGKRWRGIGYGLCVELWLGDGDLGRHFGGDGWRLDAGLEEYAFTLASGQTAVGLRARRQRLRLQSPPFCRAAPVSLTAVAFVNGASLSWGAPASDGGASVTGYVLSYGAETINLGNDFGGDGWRLDAGLGIRLYSCKRANSGWLGRGGNGCGYNPRRRAFCAAKFGGCRLC